MKLEVVFTRSASGAAVIEELIGSATQSVIAALYRFNSPRLASALREAKTRGVMVRVCLNNNDHYEENRAAQATLSSLGIPLRLVQGRGGSGSKMHHKFLVIDGQATATGSYNWTPESEDSNYENLIVLREPTLAEAYSSEFEALWREGRNPEPDLQSRG